MDDEEIVKLFLRRDEASIRQSKEKYGKRLNAISKSITLDSFTADEVENDTYFRAWESIPPKEPYSYLFAFLARIARNLSLTVCRDRSRLKRRAFIVELSEEMEQCIPDKCDIEAQLEGGALIESVNSFLKGISEEKRNVFMRRYWYMDTVNSIANRFGMSESKVKTTLFRLRNDLKAYLESEGYTL